MFLEAFFFMMAALKPVSDNSNICYLSIAMYLFIYFTQLEILLFLSVMNDFFLIETRIMWVLC